MGSQDLMGRVRALRASGYAPNQIARALGVPPATVAPLVRAIAAADQAGAAERKLLGCWMSPGWSQGLTVQGHPEWPDVDAADAGAQGLVSVLVTREERYGRVRVCGWLVDVWCLGVKDIFGPRLMDERRVSQFAGSYFAAHQAQAPSASGATASPSSSRAPATTPQPSSRRWSVPSGGTASLPGPRIAAAGT